MVPVKNSYSDIFHTFTAGPCLITSALHPLHRRLQAHSAKLSSGEICWWHGPALCALHRGCRSFSPGVRASVFSWTARRRQRSLWHSPAGRHSWQRMLLPPCRGSPWRSWRNTGNTGFLRFSTNTEEILEKCHQRQYLLRKLRSFRANKNILVTFYHSYHSHSPAGTRCAYTPSLKSALKWLNILLLVIKLSDLLTWSYNIHHTFYTHSWTIPPVVCNLLHFSRPVSFVHVAALWVF